MKRTIGLALVVSTLMVAAPPAARAQMPGHPFGIGLLLGDPNVALTAKYWMDGTDAIQIAFGWRGRYYSAPGPTITVDWQRRVGRIVPRTPVVRFGFDVGVGGGFGYLGDGCYTDVWGRSVCYDSDAALVFRVPLAFAAYFPRARVEAFAELAPGLTLMPNFFEPVLMGGVGGRFYF